MDLPSYLQLEPVGQCNLSCQMCPIQFRNDGPASGTPAFMSFELFQRVIDQFDSLDHLHLQGLGEPMMHPRFFDMVEYATCKGIRVTTNSNLTLLSEKRAERCISCGLDCLHVSIDAATPETYERIRRGGRFRRVANNLELLQQARTSAASGKPDVRLVMVIMRQNLSELPDIVRLAHRWGCSSIFVQHLCHGFQESSLPAHYRPMREFINEQTLVGEDASRVAMYFDVAREVAGAVGIELRLPHIGDGKPRAPQPGRRRCDWPWRGMYMSYQGYSMPCCMISTPDRQNFGNLVQLSATELWNSAEYNTFRDRLSGDDPPEICRSCSVYQGLF